MNITEQFSQILKKEHKDKLLPLLRSLTPEQKKEFLPDLKRLEKEYTHFGPVSEGSSQYRTKGSREQLMILDIAAFVCYTRKDFEKNYHGSIINKEVMDGILPWYCPSWFGDYINRFASDDFIPHFVRYDWYMELVEQGNVMPHPEMIAKILPQIIFEPLQKGYRYDPDKLLERPITLEEHIWYLFEYDSPIYWSDRYTTQLAESKDGYWIKTFQQFTTEGRIERSRLLREALSGANKGFNQTFSGWFVNLLAALNPDETELLTLQHELIALFNSPHSKPVNAALQYLKGIALSTGFDADAYLSHSALIITSESKSVVTSALMILEKLAKKHADKREEICIAASQALIQQDSALQLRAAKLIHKYGNREAVALKNELDEYGNTLLYDTRALLQDFLTPLAEEEIGIEVELNNYAELTEIVYPQNWEDVVFLASQAFDQNETYHFDLLPAALLKFQHQITTVDIEKLMPAFQHAYKMVTGDWSSTKGYLDDMLAEFFISWGQLLTRNRKLDTAVIKAMYESFLQKEKQKQESWSGYSMRLSGFRAWHTNIRYYSTHKLILLKAFEMLENSTPLPLLSTPTHEPCWLSVSVLIERLAQHQIAGVYPGNMDFQVAIARCHVFSKEQALHEAKIKLTGEFQALLRFVLGEDHQPQSDSKINAVWLVTALVHGTRKPNDWAANLTELAEPYLKADFQWNTIVEPYMRREYDYQQRKNVEIPDERKVLRLKFGDKHKKLPIIKSFLKKFIPQQKEAELSMYDYMELNIKYSTAQHNDIKRLLHLNPSQPDILLAQIINKSLVYSQFWEEADKRMVIKALDALLSFSYPYGAIAHLFIATCMLSSDKTVKTYAAELWIKGVAENHIQSNVIGQIIAEHEKVEFAPLKRFTDLLISHMFRISVKHNQALQELLTAYIEQASDTPINNTKKLLEALCEILALNKSRIENPKVLIKLETWQNTQALKQVVKNLVSQPRV